jgi:phospholipid/cholesterol/gamma-HCH transport system substrate-binding protein
LGGPVFYMGVEVGTVIAMEIIPGDPMRVRVDSEVLKSAPVNTGTYASLALQGITGVAVIKLNAEPGEHAPIQKRNDQVFPVIAVRNTGLSALLARAPTVVDELHSVLVQMNQILGEENREFVSDMLKDLASVSSVLASQEQTIGELPVLLNSTMNEFQSTLEQIKSFTGKLEPGISTTVDNLEQSTQNLVRMTERMESWVAVNDTDMNAFMEDGLGQVPALVADARAALREIEKLLKDLREDPSQLIYKPNEEAVDVEQ